MRREADDTGREVAASDRVRRVLSEVDGPDFERFEPPGDVWGRIEASIASDRSVSRRGPHPQPKEPPSRGLTAGTVVEYWIDADDNVAAVGQGWAEFARDNDAAELATTAPDRTIWTYFDRDEIRELWQLLVDRVRASQAEVRVPLRCDAPHARRWFEMTITPEPGGRVHFRSVLAFEESRPPVALLDPHSERDGSAPPVALCSWCGRGRMGADWLDIEELVHAARLLEQASMPPISYGICEACRDDMSTDLLVAGGVGEPPD